MEFNNFTEALDEATTWVAKHYPTSTWEGDVHDLYALLVKANFNNQVFIDYLEQAILGKVYLPKQINCIINKGKITKVTIGD
tara:strand:- start:476 stop:721 length:246 start_codon:yes stop_codon:yes gene_type:complete